MGYEEPDSLAAVQLDDLLIAALAAGDVADESDSALALLAALRRDVSGPAGAAAEPATASRPGVSPAAAPPGDARLPGVPAAVVPLPRRPLRPRLSHTVLAAGTVAAILSLGGVAAASVQAAPNSVLYPVRVLLLGPVNPAPLDVVHELLASAAADLKAGNVVAAQQHLAAAHKHLAALQQSNVGAEQALTKLESQVAAVTAPSPAAPPAPSGSAGSTGPAGTQATAASSPSASPSVPTTVDTGPQVYGQVSAQPSPTSSAPSSPTATPTASPSGDASPTASPSASASPQQPHGSASPTAPSTGGSTTPTASPS